MNYVIDKTEVYRYLGITGAAPDDATKKLIDKCAQELTAAVKPKFVRRTFRLSRTAGGYLMDGCGIELYGRTAEERLAGCTECSVLGATLGIEADTIIRRAQTEGMTAAVIYDACATDLIEKVCDGVQAEIAAEAEAQGEVITERFSPGYGDLPLDLQTKICAVLDTGRKIGVYLTEQLLLLPTKSVTAFVGIGKPENTGGRGCAYCDMRTHCAFRKTGKRCGK